MQDMRAGQIERLVCFKLDRLGRSLTHLALILDEMNRLKVPLICIAQGIDTSTDNPAGRLQLGVLMAVAEFERGIIKERVNAGSEGCQGSRGPARSPGHAGQAGRRGHGPKEARPWSSGRSAGSWGWPRHRFIRY